MSIDLHIHSNASDGTLSPEEILRTADRLGLGAIAITDHDTLEGAKQALASGIPPTLEFLTGVEISVTPPPHIRCSGSFHLLGYALSVEDPPLNDILSKLQDARKNRNPEILRRLSDLGIEITGADLLQAAEDGNQVSRPHIARAMVDKGVVFTIDDAFDQYLGKGRPAFVDKFRLSCPRAIEMIHDAGGLAVLAHPGLLNLADGTRPEDLAGGLKEMGLDGIEVLYPEHGPELEARYTDICRRFDLLMTGGTDFHGEIKPEVRMGTGRGGTRVPYALYERLTEAAAARTPSRSWT